MAVQPLLAFGFKQFWEIPLVMQIQVLSNFLQFHPNNDMKEVVYLFIEYVPFLTIYLCNLIAFISKMVVEKV